MTLHAISRQTNRSLKWVALPLEFVDWMALHFPGPFIRFLASLDPYGDILIPGNILAFAPDELAQVRKELQGSLGREVPSVVEVSGDYGISGALSTVNGMIELIRFATGNNCKVVSVGD